MIDRDISIKKFTNSKEMQQMKIVASDKSIHMLNYPYSTEYGVVPPLLNLHALATTCDVGVVIRLPICRSRHDGHPTCRRDDYTASYHGNCYWSRSTIERSGPVEQTCCRLKYIRGIGANLDLHLRGAIQCSCEENLVLDDRVGVDRSLVRGVAGGAISWTCSCGWETIPELYFLAAWALLILIRRNIVWEKITPVLVGHAVDVLMSSRWDSGIHDWANVVRFAVIIPGEYLSNMESEIVEQMLITPPSSDLPRQSWAGYRELVASEYATGRPLSIASSCCTREDLCKTKAIPASCMPYFQPLRPKRDLNLGSCPWHRQAKHPSWLFNRLAFLKP